MLHTLLVHRAHLGQIIVFKDVGNSISHPIYISTVGFSTFPSGSKIYFSTSFDLGGSGTAFTPSIWQK